jgi:uncharacterized protein (TIGR02611 family)
MALSWLARMGVCPAIHRSAQPASPYGVLILPDEPGHDQRTEPPDLPQLQEGEEAAGILKRLARRVNDLRSWFHQQPGGALTWRVGIALIGLVVIIVGIVLLVLPGPGWLIIFVGLGVWATEFAWARYLLRFVRRTVGRWTAWWARRPRWLTVLVGAVGLIVVAAVAVGAWFLVG